MVTLSIPLPSAENQSKPMLQYNKQVPYQCAEMKTQYLTSLFTMYYGYFYHLVEGNLREERALKVPKYGHVPKFRHISVLAAADSHYS